MLAAVTPADGSAEESQRARHPPLLLSTTEPPKGSLTSERNLVRIRPARCWQPCS